MGTSPDGVLPAHLAEWIEGSACHPELAAANLQTLQGAEVLERLVAAKLTHLGGHASQYATAEVQKLLRPLEPVAEAGGWWCSGLDPLRDWAPMGWGCFKPDAPRRFGGKALKYENPHGTPARSFWLRVPAAVAKTVAARWELPLPLEVLQDETGEAGEFWRWWAATPELPLVLTEGAKKAGALLSAGIPAVALNGIWGGCPKNAAGRPTLLSELETVWQTGSQSCYARPTLQGRPCLVLFDWSDSERGRRDVAKAARRLGGLLKRAGASEVKVGACPGPAKGADDHLAAGGTWEQLEAELEVLQRAPVLPSLRRADRTAPAGSYLSDACPIPSPQVARLVALRAPMGSGKTEAIKQAVARLRADGYRVVLITHRRSLGATLAAELDLPWAEDAAPGSDLRQLGIALCADSLSPRSAMRFRPQEWSGAVVVMDEAAQVLSHALMTHGTAVAKRRTTVLENLGQLLRGAAQVVAADAQLSTPVLKALESATGHKALLIGSEHQPAAGRRLVAHTSRDSWRVALVEHLQQRQRLWIATTAQKAEAPNSAQNIAALAQQHWPGVRVLVVDSTTVSDSEHDAHRLAADPNGIASRYDLVVATPAVAAGLSVTLREHFAAVFGWAGGTTDPAAAAQAMARVRDDCPRHLYAPDASPSNALRVGSGSPKAAQVLQQLNHHEAAALGQLLLAGGWNPGENSGGPWLQLWGQLAALQNAQRLSYAATVLGLLEREGYRIERAGELEAPQAAAARDIGGQLKALAEAAEAAEEQAICSARVISDAEAQELAEKRRLTPAEKVLLRRHRIAAAWGLGQAKPSPEVMQAHKERLHRRLRFRWLLQNRKAQQLVAQVDLRASIRLTGSNGEVWAPDLCRVTETPALQAATAIGLVAWIRREGWFSSDDPALLRLQKDATTYAAALTQVLGISPGKRATTTLRQLLALAGYRLETRRRRRGDGRSAAATYEYRVVAEALPAGADPAVMEASWLAFLERNSQGPTPHHLPAGHGEPGSWSWEGPAERGARVCTEIRQILNGRI